MVGTLQNIPVTLVWALLSETLQKLAIVRYGWDVANITCDIGKGIIIRNTIEIAHRTLW